MTTIEATSDQISIADEPTDDARLLGHAYDGIREYDNPLPSWWRIVFVGSVVFAAFYGLYFHVVGWGRTPDAQYRAALASYDAKHEQRERAELANVSEASVATATADPKVVARGAEVFASRCVSCHGPEGAGLIGPNLTDSRQLHGSSRLELYMTVRGGVPGSAMVAWGEQLPPADVFAVAAFAITLRGKNLPGRPPEGVPVGPFSP